MRANHRETVNRIVENQWGLPNQKNLDEAEGLMANDPQKLAAWALVELLGRLNRLGGQTRSRYDPDEELTIPKECQSFPQTKVGDILWCGSMDDGFYRSLVVEVDAQSRCICVSTDGGLQIRTERFFASQGYYPTLDKAIRAAIAEDKSYHAPRLRYAEEVESALNSGADPSQFSGAHDYEEEGV